MLNTKQILLLVAAVFVVLIFVFLQYDNRKRYKWEEDYEQNSTQPYGINSLQTLLDNWFPDAPLQVNTDSLTGNLPTDGRGTFVAIGPSMYLSELDRSALLTFVSNGGDAILACEYFPYDLMFFLYFDQCEDYAWDDLNQRIDTTIAMNFLHPQLRRHDSSYVFTFVQQNQPNHYSWNSFYPEYFCEQDSGLVALGTLDGSDEYNFARRAYGKGYFYLHTNPLVFTNYFVHSPEGRSYIEKVFAHARNGPIIWDEYSRQSEAVMRQMDGSSRGTPGSDDRLRYILANPPLAWAWYLLLGAGLLYILLHTKRRQRVIPVHEPNTNTTLEYLNTIGRLYFSQKNDRQLAKQQIKLWRQHLWHHYQLRYDNQDATLAERLSAKSGRPRPLVDKVLNKIAKLEQAHAVSEQDLIYLHQRLEDFYHYQNPNS